MITEGRDREYALTDHLIIHFLELPKIKDSKMISKMAGWLLYLKAEGRDRKMMKILLESDEDLRSAHEMYKAFNSNDKLRRYAFAREKAETDKRYFEKMAKRREAEGLAKGREEGELEEKHNVLIRLLELKYSLSEKEKKHILSVTDFRKLNEALDTFVFSKEKESVLKLL